MSRILITGGAGFIGSSFVNLAVEKGFTVTVIDALTYAGYLGNISSNITAGKVTFVKGDICDSQKVIQLLDEGKFQWVVNFAAESHVDNSISGPAPFIETNVRGTFVLLEACRQYWSQLSGVEKDGFRYLQVSTDEVYGSLGETGKFSEQTAYAPNSPYSASKAGADHLVTAWYKTYGLPTLLTNCSNNYGPRQYPEKLIPLMIDNAISGKSLPVYGNGENVRDWIHVSDHCRGIWLALDRGVPGQTYCFGGNSERKNIDVVKSICSQLDCLRPREDGRSYEEQITYVDDRLGHDWRYAIDDSKAETQLGFQREFKNFEQGLVKTVDWYLQNQDWVQAVKGKSL